MVGNYTVPVGHQLCVSPTVNSKLDEVWDQSEEFIPDRSFLHQILFHVLIIQLRFPCAYMYCIYLCCVGIYYIFSHDFRLACLSQS